MSERDISIEEWLRALERVQENPEGAFTISDISRQMQRPSEWIRSRLREYMARGDIRVTSVRLWRPGIDGWLRPVPGYRITVTRKAAAKTKRR